MSDLMSVKLGPVACDARGTSSSGWKWVYTYYLEVVQKSISSDKTTSSVYFNMIHHCNGYVNTTSYYAYNNWSGLTGKIYVYRVEPNGSETHITTITGNPVNGRCYGGASTIWNPCAQGTVNIAHASDGTLKLKCYIEYTNNNTTTWYLPKGFTKTTIGDTTAFIEAYRDWKVTVVKGSNSGISSVSGEGTYSRTSSVTTDMTVSSGYKFSKYTTSGITTTSGTTSKLTFEMPNNDVTVTYYALPISYKCTLDYSDATDATVSAAGNGWTQNTLNLTKEISYNSKLNTLPTLKRNNYSFDGWYTTKTGGTKITSDTVYNKTSNVTYYAHWTNIVKYFSWSAPTSSTDYTVISTTASGTYSEGTSISFKIKLNDGYENLVVKLNDKEISYKSSDTGGNTYSFSISANSKVTVSTTEKTYTITYDANGKSVNDLPATQIKKHNIQITISYTSPRLTKDADKEKYYFMGWSTTADGSVDYYGGKQYKENKNLTLYAVWGNSGSTVKDVLVWVLDENGEWRC